MSSPKVSVLMPVYRTNEDFLRTAIESILKQTFTDFEFLILDDCPTDDREKIVKSYKDERIKYTQNKHNLGISQTRNKLIEMAKGEYLAVFDHDDISLPQRLEKEVAYMDEHPEIGVVSCKVKVFPLDKVLEVPSDNLAIKKGLMSGNVVPHTAMMLRKSVLEKYNIRYEEEYSPAEDYMLCLRLMKYTMFHNLPEVLLEYRSQEGNTSYQRLDELHNADAMCKCFAYKEYPFFKQIHHEQIKLFNIIPFIKIKHSQKCSKYKLFGIIPLWKIQ